MRNYIFTSAILALVCCAAPSFADTASICDGVAGNLVLNCGFETGDFSNWTVLNDTGNNTSVQGPSFTLGGGVNSGDFFAALGDVSAQPTTLEQTFADVDGSTLTFSFYLATSGASNDFTASFDGDPLLSVPDAPRAGYTEYSYTVTGTGSDTISFSVQNAFGWDGLDDVVVVDPVSATPEPSSLAFAAAAFGALVLVHLRRAKKTA
jgi:hypothetical protein